MTVGELISELQKFDPKSPIAIAYDSGYAFCRLDCVFPASEYEDDDEFWLDPASIVLRTDQ